MLRATRATAVGITMRGLPRASLSLRPVCVPCRRFQRMDIKMGTGSTAGDRTDTRARSKAMRRLVATHRRTSKGMGMDLADRVDEVVDTTIDMGPVRIGTATATGREEGIKEVTVVDMAGDMAVATAVGGGRK